MSAALSPTTRAYPRSVNCFPEYHTSQETSKENFSLYHAREQRTFVERDRV